MCSRNHPNEHLLMTKLHALVLRNVVAPGMHYDCMVLHLISLQLPDLMVSKCGSQSSEGQSTTINFVLTHRNGRQACFYSLYSN